ncbi:unnamed protein product [Rhodiola kirilowii]
MNRPIQARFRKKPDLIIRRQFLTPLMRSCSVEASNILC